ncbi:uncharacterized protein LOC116007551 [Ipomoea triloba]|uniref:uncharacterized protein LOC116007551 n=1 Tax=Ipomoea triloba TaxID=35885 RepID=UPI00125E6B41|nr:uncharacterized protein LOC116007551 [Ipomoea triloba]
MNLSIHHGPVFPFFPTRLASPSPIIPTFKPYPNSTPSFKSCKTQTPNPKSQEEDDGIPFDDVKILAKYKSRHNYIRVLEVSRTADHPLAGSRLLLLDAPGNIHSISYLLKSTTAAYYDVLATLPPVLPPGPVGLLGFGAGSSARLILESYPSAVLHGWELDPSVISVAKTYFNLDKLQNKHPDRLYVHVGNALNAQIRDGFSGLLVDLFSKGCVIPELQSAETWKNLKRKLRKGGAIMANVGGSCVEPEDIRRDGGEIMEETLKAMHGAFPESLFVMSLGNSRVEDSTLAFAGKLPDLEKWKRALPPPLKMYADMWRPYRGRVSR